MDIDIELEQVISTSLSLQDDYPELFPSLGGQDKITHSEALWSSQALPPELENMVHLQKTSRKRSLSEEEQVGCKRPRSDNENLTATYNNRCRKRTVFNKEQTLFLQIQFKLNPYPDFVTRCCIAKKTSIPEPRIQVWFQNRRARHLPKHPKLQDLEGIEASAVGVSPNFNCMGYTYNDPWAKVQIPPKMWLFPNGVLGQY